MPLLNYRYFAGQPTEQTLIKMQHQWCIENNFRRIKTTKNSHNIPMLILTLHNGFEITGTFLHRHKHLKVLMEKSLIDIERHQQALHAQQQALHHAQQQALHADLEAKEAALAAKYLASPREETSPRVRAASGAGSLGRGSWLLRVS